MAMVDCVSSYSSERESRAKACTEKEPLEVASMSRRKPAKNLRHFNSKSALSLQHSDLKGAKELLARLPECTINPQVSFCFWPSPPTTMQ